MLRTTLLTACSLLVAGCGAGLPARPNTDLCVINAPGKHLKCYNIARDYDDQGMLLKTAKPTFKPFEQTADINKFIATDPAGWAALKAYMKSMREELSQRCN